MDLGEHRETAKLSATGVLAVLTTGISVSFLTPENQNGRLIKFFTPLLVGILFGAKIYFKELEKVKEKLNN